MAEQTQWGDIGADEPIVALIRQYYPNYPDGPLGEVVTDPQTALQAIRVVQEQGDDVLLSEAGSSSTSTTASYFAEEYTVTADGPRVQDDEENLVEPEHVDGKKIDAGAVYSEWDLRGFNDDIMIAWTEPAREHRDIKYPAADSPVAGVPAETQYVWLWRAESATSDPAVRLEGWS
jgi:hypothetical protein